jgi:hypothetical protein
MTNLTLLYEKFLSKITDYRILEMTEQEIADDLYDYYDSARAIFYKCKNSLETVEIGNDTFIESDLTRYEIEILVSLMLVEHITPQLLSSENMKQSLSDKSFKVYSQANQLREIRLLLEGLESKTEKMITQYTFFDLDKEKM